MKNKWTYPRFFKDKNGLKAFLTKDKMFVITNQGRNMNPGVCVDHFITRRMVLRHQHSPGTMISREEFIRLYQQLFDATLNHIMQTVF